MDGLVFGTGGVSTAVAIILAKLIWNKWFSGNGGKTHESHTGRSSRHATAADMDALEAKIELRFSQQHEDLKAIKSATYEVRELCRWLKEAHDARDADGSFRWWNKATIESLIRACNNLDREILAHIKARAEDAAQAKRDIIAAVQSSRS